MEAKEAQLYVVELIRNHITQLKVKNSSLSLRSFAKRIEVSPATLSQALNGKRLMTKATVRKVLEEIAPNDELVWKYLESFKDYYVSEKKSLEEVMSQRIPEDELAFFKKWYHLAMVTFFDSVHYDGSIVSIANYFQISVSEAQEAVDRLKRLGIVEQKEDRLKNTSLFYFTDRSRLAESIHTSKTEALKNAVKALETKTAPEISDFSMMFTVFDPSLLPDAIAYIDKMKKGFVKNFNGKGNKSAVYQMSIQFMPCGKAPELDSKNETSK